MIPLKRPEAPERLKKLLSGKTQALVNGVADAATARAAWKSSRVIRRDVKALLSPMASGFSRCMYCGDSQGTDIDHFKPIAKDPLSAFVWVNHLLACSHCNSNEKRDEYPCDSSGECLLVNPSAEDPWNHLVLTLTTGKYTGVTLKGRVTIQVFGLGRPDLERGRAMAYVRCKSMLRDWAAQTEAGRDEDARMIVESLTVHPFADVLYAMVRRAQTPGAVDVFGNDIMFALRNIESATFGGAQMT
ncbi:HNH endonuclease [Actinacidiphila bryophytorum]|uniref:HNH endonuclease n=1 Tax=Actinacidiphila bryophytorum TaxID=1436133 RepID=UPI002176C855|nr:HNH endonuclease [Actinacidiphila bryophytorum]UWE13349.1 HNH endonuclease [Actinacidiphila bryophytorum]